MKYLLWLQFTQAGNQQWMENEIDTVGIKTYYVFHRTGTVRQVKTKAIHVRELKQDLLGCKPEAKTNNNYRVILDKENDISGVYSIAEDDSIDLANNFQIVSEHSESQFNLRIDAISAKKYLKFSGYDLSCELWHRRQACNYEKCSECTMSKPQHSELIYPAKGKSTKAVEQNLYGSRSFIGNFIGGLQICAGDHQLLCWTSMVVRFANQGEDIESCSGMAPRQRLSTGHHDA